MKNFRIHTLYFLAIVFLMIFFPSLNAQRSGKNAKNTVISEDVRKQSGIFADGLRSFYSDNYSSAEKSFRSVIAQNPQNDAAFFMLSKIRSANSDFAGAAYYLGEARKIDKQNEWYLIEMAKVYDNLGDYKQSSKLWEEVCKLKPDNEFYLFALADSYLNQEKFTEVIKVYDRLEKLLGINDEISAAKKNIYLYLNDVKSAVAEYDRLIKIYPYEIKYYIQAANIYLTNNYPDRAVPYLESALKMDKDNPLIHLTLSNYYEIKGKNDDRFKSLLIAFRSPDLMVEEKLPLLRNYVAGAYKTKEEKSLKRSRQLIDALIEAHPESLEAWATLAGLQLMKESYQDARISLEKVLSLDPSRYNVWEDYIFVLAKLKDYQTIANNAEEITELFPTNSLMFYNLGVACQYLKQPDKAIEYLNQASMYAYENSLLGAIYEMLGDAYDDLGNRSEALKSWKLAQKKGINSQELKDKIEQAEKQ